MRKKRRIVAWLLVTVLLLAVWPGGTFRTNAEELKTKENGDVVSDGTETAVDGTEEITVTAKDGVRVVNAVKEIPVYYDTDDAGNAGSNVETADAEGTGDDVDSPDNKDSADAGDREPSAEEGSIPEEKNTGNHGEEPASARSVVLSEERAEDDHREGNAEGKKAKAEEKGEKKEEEEEEKKEEKKEEEGSDKKVDESKLPSGLDFSSCELLVGTKDRSLVEGKKELISEYDGVYLLHYDSEMDAKLDYLCFSKKADFVEVNETLAVSDEDPAVTGKSGEGAQDAISCMKELRSGSDLPERTIALIDTGVNAEGLVDAVSLTGGVDYDDHGHGTRMFRHIREEYPDARVLSVKAMDGTIAPKETSRVLPLQQLASGELKTPKSGALLAPDEFDELCNITMDNVRSICRDIQSGRIDIAPKKEKSSSGEWTKTSCTYCSYKSICLFDTSFRNCRYKLV